MRSLILALALTALPAALAAQSSDSTTTPPAPAESAASAEAAADEATTLALAGDPVNGESQFRLCSQCHSLNPNQNRAGPTLHNIIGREAGSIERYRYSNPMRESGIVWTEVELDRFLEAPQEVVPRSRMAFTGLSDAQQRADIIAYLAAQSGQ